nr:YfhO family protein [Ligilactobacillus aviarius]
MTLQNGKLLNQPLQLFVAIESPQRLQQLHQYAVNPNISDIKVDGDWITFKTNSRFKGGYLGLSILFDPNWSVRIDHQKGHVVKILGDLSGIKVPQGAHQVRLKYNVNGLKIGMIISIISLIILGGYEITKRKLKRK